MVTRLEELVLEYCEAKTFSSECVDEVVAFVQDISTVLDRNVEFIKRLTKVAYKIWEREPALLDQSLERIYQFNGEGLERIARGETNNINTARVINLESHFHGYMGSIAQELANRSNDKLNWLQKSYNHKKTAGEIVSKSDPIYAAYAFSIAANISEEIFAITSDNIWLKEGYALDRKSGDLSKNLDKKHSSHCYSHGADRAKKLYGLTQDQQWLVNCYDMNKMAGDIGKEIDSRHAFYSYGFAGDAAKELWEKTRQKEWLEKWCTAHYDSAVVALTWNQAMAVKSFEKSGDIVYNNRSRLRGNPIIRMGIDAYRRIPNHQSIKNIQGKIFELKKYAA